MLRLTFLLGILLPVSATGADMDPEFRNSDRIVPAHRIETGVRVDGLLDEEAWQASEPATDFVQFEPNEGGTPSQHTEVRVLYTSNAVYIGASLFDTEASMISATLGRRDEVNQADWFQVSIDSYFDRKTAYTFGVNAAGVQMDGITTGMTDESWDAVWQSSVRITDEGWFAEIRIPLTMLRFVDGANTWGINFRREIPRTSETLEWAMVPRTERRSGYVARYGRLMGIERLSPARNIQVLPYTVSRLDTFEDDAVPGARASSTDVDLGVDFKIGLTSNITLDATVNPDFGQVEADPAQLNLTAFETFFDERRPFFVEGSQIMEFRTDFDGSLLYTRRIGASEPIIGAAKVSGRTDGGLSFGVLGATTGDSFSPERLFSLVRARQEIGSFSSVGAIVTATNKSLDDGDVLGLTTGADWDIRMGANKYQLDGFFSATDRSGSALGDSERGIAGSLGFDRVQGSLTWGQSFRFFGDTFDPNDLGRLRRNDFMRASSSISYQINDGQPFWSLQRASVRAFGWKSWSYRERIDQGIGLMLNGDLVTRRFERLSMRYHAEYLTGGYDVYETRGLLPYAQPAEHSIEGTFRTDSRKLWNLESKLDVSRNGDGSTGIRPQLQANWNASNRIDLSAEIGLGRNANQTAWVANEAIRQTTFGYEMGLEAADPADLGADDWMAIADDVALDALGLDPWESRRVSVFGSRDTRSADITLRSNVTFTPRLSIQMYGQLFAARGRYEDFSLHVDADNLARIAEYPKRHDFSQSSFQTNVVLRWEYRPGSSLFLVWSQSRRDSHRLDPLDTVSGSPYNVDTASQLTDTFGLYPANAFLIKLNYIFLP